MNYKQLIAAHEAQRAMPYSTELGSNNAEYWDAFRAFQVNLFAFIRDEDLSKYTGQQMRYIIALCSHYRPADPFKILLYLSKNIEI